MATKGPKNSANTPAAAPIAKRTVKAKVPAAAVTVPDAVQPVAPPIAAPAPEAVTPAAPVPAVETAPVIAPAVETVSQQVVDAVTEQAAQAVTTAAAQTAETAKENVMATTYEAPKAMNDFNDRAKTAMEKGSKMFEEMNDFAKGNVEAMVESGRITAKGFETMGQDAAEYSRKSFESMTATLKNLAAVKSPADFFKLQSDYVRSSFDSAVAEASKGTEAMIKLAGDAAQPISNRFAVAAEKVKTAA